MAYKFQLGAAYLEGVTTYEDDLKSTGEISGSSAGEFHTLEVGQGNFTVNKLGVLDAGATTVDSLSVNDGNITNVGSIALDSISADDGSSFSMGSNWTNASRTVADLGSVTTCDINGGAIDGVTIGAASAGAGTFAALVGTSLSATGDVDLGDAVTDSITCTGRFDSDLIPLTDSSRDLGTSALQWAEAHIDTGHIDTLTATGTSTLTTVDINGGAIDGTIIGAASTAAGSFTAINGTTIDGSGDATFATITMTGFAVDADGDVALKSVAVDNGSTIGCDAAADLLTLSDGIVLVEADAELQFRDTGLNIASSLNGWLDISADTGLNLSASVRTTGTVYTGGAFTGASSISGAAGLAGMSLVVDDGATIGVASDTNLLELESNTLNVNGKVVVSSVSELVVDPNGSRPFIVWNDGNNAFDYLSWATFVTGVVGSGLSAASGKISLSAAGTINAIGNETTDLVEGLNYATASLTANRDFRLPAASALSNGDVVRVKMAAGVSDSNYAKITCSVGAADNIDGETEIRLESTYAAVELYKVAANTWRVL